MGTRVAGGVGETGGEGWHSILRTPPHALARARVVVVGGGGAGLSLISRLAGMLGRRAVELVLIDPGRAHLWKPLVHEVAAGTLPPHRDFLPYAYYAQQHGFTFVHGRMDGIDRERREVWITPSVEFGGPPPQRRIHYDTLVIAIGSVADASAIPGAAEHAFFLDSVEQAEQVQQYLLLAFLRTQNEKLAQGHPGTAITIVGGGAVGVELAAELRRAANALVARGFHRLTSEYGVHITLLESEGRVLPELPRRFSEAAARELARLGVHVLCAERVTHIGITGVETASGLAVPSSLTIWAAGIKAPDILATLGGLETNASNQLVVGSDFKTTRDAAIFALGDCAAVPWSSRPRGVPPTAEAAYQEAEALARMLARRARGGASMRFVYKDRGSLAALGRAALVGHPRKMTLRSIAIQRWCARVAYRLLYSRHRATLGAPFGGVLRMLVDLFPLRPNRRLKVH